MSIDSQCPSALNAIVLSPYAGCIGHLANRRANRFCRWLTEAGFNVTLVGALKDHRPEIDHKPIPYIYVGNPLHAVLQSQPVRTGTKRGLKSLAARYLLIPDGLILWSIACALNSSVRLAARRSSLIVSTSPPESPHLTGLFLSRLTGVPHVVDLRDGWTDEPLKRQITESRVRRWIETSMERAVLANAALVLVTSNEWKELLLTRVPRLQSKTHVLTNAYGSRGNLKPEPIAEVHDLPRLVYTGKLGLSHANRDLGALVSLLMCEASLSLKPFEIKFIGQLQEREIEQLEHLAKEIKEYGWKVTMTGNVSETQSKLECATAAGLLLLSVSHAALPSKLFDYMATGLPILAMSPIGSATWNVCRQLPQAWQVDLNGRPQDRTCPSFVTFVRSQPQGVIPAQFEEGAVGRRFSALLEAILQLPTQQITAPK
jgi:glycosyltransferase involved in cell wall biosynthesis